MERKLISQHIFLLHFSGSYCGFFTYIFIWFFQGPFLYAKLKIIEINVLNFPCYWIFIWKSIFSFCTFYVSFAHTHLCFDGQIRRFFCNVWGWLFVCFFLSDLWKTFVKNHYNSLAVAVSRNVLSFFQLNCEVPFIEHFKFWRKSGVNPNYFLRWWILNQG